MYAAGSRGFMQPPSAAHAILPKLELTPRDGLTCTGMSDFRDILGLSAGAAGGGREWKKEPALKKPAGVSREVSVQGPPHPGMFAVRSHAALRSRGCTGVLVR